MKYLGLPLSDKGLTRADYLPVIDRVQKALAGWRAPLLSIGGRFILKNSVLAAIPQYFMSVFWLPKWVVRRIDQIRRVFFWHGHKDQHIQKKYFYMVNWQLATRPRKIGGLGLRDTRITNQSLLMKWLWQWCENDQAWWKEITLLPSTSDKPWHASNGSLFWKSMKSITEAFHSSTSYQVGNGKKCQFWHDNWAGSRLKLLFPNLFQTAQNKEVSVYQCAMDANWIRQLQMLSPQALTEKEMILHYIRNLQLSQLEDSITWLRNQTSFSVKSAYNFLSLTPSPDSNLQNIWQIKAPLRIKIFAWLLLTNRLSTIDNLKRRGWQLPNMCLMCGQNEETVSHLFQTCILAREVRSYIQVVFGDQYNIPMEFTTDHPNLMLLNSKENKLASEWEITTCFILWRERCRRIFSEKELRPISIVREIKLEWSSWFADMKQ